MANSNSSAFAPRRSDAAGGILPFPLLVFGAFAWTVVHQFRDHLGLHAGDRSGLLFKGYLGGDLFLILAGLLACRALARPAPGTRSSYGAMIWRSIAPNYPLHLATIAAMAALLLAGRMLGGDFDQTPFNLAALPANLLLIHTWGVLPTVYWNFPSWLLSVELAGCLIVPALAWSARRTPALAAIAALVIFEIMFAAAAARGVLFTDMTAQVGVLRAVPDFLMGAAIWALLDRATLSRRTAEALAAVSLAWIVAASWFRASDMLIWPAFAGLVFGLAARQAGEAPAAASSLAQRLGRVAFAMYLTYLPVDIAYFHAMRRLDAAPTGWTAWAIWAGVFPVILLVGIAAYLLVERPAGGWLLQHNPFVREPQLVSAPSQRRAPRLQAAQRTIRPTPAQSRRRSKTGS